MASTLELKTRLSPETKRIVQAVARQQQITESAWLRRLIDVALQTAGIANAPASTGAVGRVPRAERLMIRLRADDRVLLQARAESRGLASATYASLLLRAHLRALAPIPTQELAALKRAIAEVGAIGRNLNQIVRISHQSGRVTGPSQQELLAILRACEALRSHVKDLLKVNIASWERGHAQADG
jgi:hypothetical protein